MKRALAVVTLVAGLALSCIDPVHNDAVDALGGETNGARPGPNHRPGQPCLVCHGGHGPGSPEFSIAGTIMETRGGTTAATNVDIVLTDAAGATRTLRSNSVGSFYVDKSQWDPSFPIKVVVTSGSTRTEMKSEIGRDGACATCHRDPGDATHMPAVFLVSQ